MCFDNNIFVVAGSNIILIVNTPVNNCYRRQFIEIMPIHSHSTYFTGEGTLEFLLAGYVTQTFPIEVHEGGEITQDVSLAEE